MTDQVVRGNEIKLLAAPKEEQEADAAKDVKAQNRELRSKAQEVRNLMNQVAPEDLTRLLTAYSDPLDEGGEEGKSKTGTKKSEKSQ